MEFNHAWDCLIGVVFTLLLISLHLLAQALTDSGSADGRYARALVWSLLSWVLVSQLSPPSPGLRRMQLRRRHDDFVHFVLGNPPSQVCCILLHHCRTLLALQTLSCPLVALLAAGYLRRRVNVLQHKPLPAHLTCGGVVSWSPVGLAVIVASWVGFGVWPSALSDSWRSVAVLVGLAVEHCAALSFVVLSQVQWEQCGRHAWRSRLRVCGSRCHHGNLNNGAPHVAIAWLDSATSLTQSLLFHKSLVCPQLYVCPLACVNLNGSTASLSSASPSFRACPCWAGAWRKRKRPWTTCPPRRR